MPTIPETNSTGPSVKCSLPLMPIVAGCIVLLILLAVCCFPYWFEGFIRRGHEGWTRHQMAEVKEGMTTSISDPAPELLEELAKDRDCTTRLRKYGSGKPQDLVLQMSDSDT